MSRWLQRGSSMITKLFWYRTSCELMPSRCRAERSAMRSCTQVGNGSASVGSGRCADRRSSSAKLRPPYRDKECILQPVKAFSYIWLDKRIYFRFLYFRTRMGRKCNPNRFHDYDLEWKKCFLGDCKPEPLGIWLLLVQCTELHTCVES